MNKINADKVKSGDLMAFVYWAKVQDIKNNTYRSNKTLTVYDLDNKNPFDVHGKSLIEQAYSADQYAEEKKVSKTECAEILVTSFGKPFTVAFEKDDGTERTLRGRLIKPESLLGRSMVEDLDIAQGNRIRQVDHRTLCWLIVDNVKYVVK